jgi:hypothetical protein
MKKQTRFALAFATLAGFVLSLGLVTVAAQAGLASADAAKFMGGWTLGLDTPQGALTMDLTLKDNAGKVAASITSDIAPAPMAITDISKDGENLVLKYELDVQGQSIPAMITIIPDGAKWKASFDFAGGQFVVDGTAVKK